MVDFIIEHGLDIFTTVLGIVYLILEYRASIALWVVGIIMPALDVYLYWSHGLYGDAGMAVYYTLAAIYGYAVWRFGKKRGAFDNIQIATDSVNDYPERPLLYVFACQCPQADEA